MVPIDWRKMIEAFFSEWLMRIKLNIALSPPEAALKHWIKLNTNTHTHFVLQRGNFSTWQWWGVTGSLQTRTTCHTSALTDPFVLTTSLSLMALLEILRDVVVYSLAVSKLALQHDQVPTIETIIFCFSLTDHKHRKTGAGCKKQHKKSTENKQMCLCLS